MREYAINSAAELLENIELSDIGCYELYAARGVERENGREIVGPGGVTDLVIEDQDQELGVYWLGEGGRLLVRLAFVLTTNAGEMRAGVQAEWDTGLLQRSDVSPDAEEDWVNRVAVMAIVPYIRSAISDLAVRMYGSNILMPLVRPNELTFSSLREAHEQPQAQIEKS